jgi:hypothetical protein
MIIIIIIYHNDDNYKYLLNDGMIIDDNYV